MSLFSIAEIINAPTCIVKILWNASKSSVEKDTRHRHFVYDIGEKNSLILDKRFFIKFRKAFKMLIKYIYN
jgi:hypothetical protein